jgi:hypothetical protein
LGTNLVTTREYFSSLFNHLYQQIEQQSGNISFGDFLLRYAKANQILTRLHKDIEYGEYNISLHNLMDAPASMRNLLLFGTNVVYFANCYQKCTVELQTSLTNLSTTLKDDRISRLILRFVKFHEYIYSYRFDDQAGDYATKPQQQMA